MVVFGVASYGVAIDSTHATKSFELFAAWSHRFTQHFFVLDDFHK